MKNEKELKIKINIKIKRNTKKFYEKSFVRFRLNTSRQIGFTWFELIFPNIIILNIKNIFQKFKKFQKNIIIQKIFHY